MTRTIKIIFTASVLLNVLLAGAGAGLAYQQWSTPRWGDVKNDISPEARDIMKASFQKSREQMQALKEEAKRKKQQIVDVLNADTFDVAAYDKAMGEMMVIQTKMARRKLEAMREVSQSLSTEDRRKLSEKIASSLDRSFGKRGHPESKDEHRTQADQGNKPVEDGPASAQFRQD